jgi:hypothetical protein
MGLVLELIRLLPWFLGKPVKAERAEGASVLRRINTHPNCARATVVAAGHRAAAWLQRVDGELMEKGDGQAKETFRAAPDPQNWPIVSKS